MFDIAAIDNRGDAGDDLAPATRAEGHDLEMRRKQAATRQQIDLVLHVRRPPRRATVVNPKWKPREFLQLLAAGGPFDADRVARDFRIRRHQLSRVARSIILIAARQAKIIHELNVKPAVGFTLPSAGLSPAPSVKRKMRDFVPVRKLFGAEARRFRHAPRNHPGVRRWSESQRASIRFIVAAGSWSSALAATTSQISAKVAPRDTASSASASAFSRSR
jgi:hypothetical protein